jgi:hypothetical protein
MDKSAKFHIYEIFDLPRSISFHVAFLQRIAENNCLAKKKEKTVSVIPLMFLCLFWIYLVGVYYIFLIKI